MQKEIKRYVLFLNQICDKIKEIPTDEPNYDQQYRFIIDNLTNMLYKDYLTQLYNRRYFEEIIIKELSRFKRYGYIFSICMMDLNGFKQINDTYGHLKGDEILKKFAGILSANSRTSDILCRWGGDEFTVILPHTTCKEIEPYVKKIIFALKNPIENLLLNVGIGATSVIPNDTKNSLIERADEALYEAKKQKTSAYVIL